VHRVAAVAQHERGRLEAAPLAAVRSHATEEQALQHGASRPRFLAHEVEHHVAVVRKNASRDSARASREPPHRALAYGQRDEQRRERERAPQQGVVEHWHLDHHPAQPLGVGVCDLERGVGAERGAHHRRLLDLQMVHQGDDLLAEEGHRVPPHVPRPVRFAVPEQIYGDHVVAAGG